MVGTTQPSAGRVRGWVTVAATLVAIFGLAGWYYQTHREQRARELKAQYAMTLAHLGREVELRYANYGQVVGSLTTTRNLLPSYDLGERGECLRQSAATPDGFGLCVSRAMARSNNADARNLRMVRCPAFVRAGGLPVVTADGDGSDSRGAAVFFPPGSGAQDTTSVCGSLPVGQLVGERPGPSAAAFDRAGPEFDEVLLLRDDATSLYGPSGSRDRIISLPGLDPQQPLVSKILPGIALGTGVYDAYLQPIDVAVAFPSSGAADAPPTRKGRLVLCGLLGQDRFAHERDRVLPTTFVVWAAVLALGILLLPLTKLWLVGPRTRFRRFDVALLVTSSLGATFLCTVLVLAYHAGQGLYGRMDHQLEEVATGVSGAFEEQVKEASHALFTFERETSPLRAALVAGNAEDARRQCRAGGVNAGSPGDGSQPPLPPVCERLNVPASELDVPGARYNLAFWANAKGDQQIKLVPPPNQHASNPINVSGRSYFQLAQQGRISCLAEAGESGCANGDHRGAIEVVRSATTGAIVLVVAKPTPVSDGDAPGVAATEWPLGPLETPVLPLGFQMAIVAGDGVIMLHSNNEAHHGQNLFDEVASPGALKAAIASGQPASMDATYLGVESRLFVQRLPGLDWFVVTVARRDLVEATVANTMLFTSIGYVLIGVAALLVLTLAAVVLRSVFAPRTPEGRVKHRGFFTVRPDARHHHVYARAALRMLALNAALVIATLAVGPHVPVTVLVLASLGGAALSLAWLPYFGGKTFREAWRERFAGAPPSGPTPPTARPLAFPLACMGLASALVVTPATALFVGSFDQAVDSLLRAEQDHYAQSRSDCARCVSEHRGASCASVFLPSETKTTADDVAWRSASCAVWPTPCLQDMMPTFPVGGDSRASCLCRARASDRPATPTQRVWLRSATVLALVPARSAEMITTPLPRLLDAGRDGPRLVWELPLLLVAVLLAFAVSYYSLRRLFLLDVTSELCRARPVDVAKLVGEGGGEKVLVQSARPEVKEALVRRGFAALDGSRSDPEIYAELPPILEAKPPEALCRAIDDPKATVVVLSQADPVARAADEVRTQWAIALSPLRVEMDTCPPEASPSEHAGTARFVRWWSESTEQERMVLAQLAIDGYPSPHPTIAHVVRDLCTRGLVSDGTLAIVDERFSEFVRSEVSESDLQAWETSEGTAWSILRVPLTAAVTVLLAMIGNQAPEAAATGAAVPALAAALPVVLRIVTGAGKGAP